jgi:hypothetical protein
LVRIFRKSVPSERPESVFDLRRIFRRDGACPVSLNKLQNAVRIQP